jgi:hypothetical protein
MVNNTGKQLSIEVLKVERNGIWLFAPGLQPGIPVIIVHYLPAAQMAQRRACKNV